ncbi:Ubiquitin carboxyl-terminal hydrolase isozyme L5 (UCH-L5) (Ubiquitin thioesterase L5), partial [Durusdinium trenchii]
SDPGVFTELIEKIGVKDVQVEELWSLGDEDFAPLKPVYGLIFLFKWRREQDDRPVGVGCHPDLFFAKQVITNACATQALLSILLNAGDAGVDVGPNLRDFQSFCGGLDPETAGEAINNLEEVRFAHNSFNRPEPFISDDSGRVAGKNDDVFHFIAYIPFKGKIYELDGLKPGPICLGELGPDADWLAAVRPHITQRIERYSSSEIRFNLMAVVKDQRVVLQEDIDKGVERIAALEGALNDHGDEMEDANFAVVPITDDDGFKELLDAKDYGALKAQLRAEQEAKKERLERLEVVKQKFAAWKEENIRRKHSYIPFCVSMLKILAKEKQLQPLIEAAFKKQEERIAAAAAANAK